MAWPRSGLRRFLFTLLLASGLLLIVGAQPALAHPTNERAKGIIAAPDNTPAMVVTSQTKIDPPVIILTQYQKRWVEDRSRFKIGIWSRQSGKSFSTSLEAVFDCYENAGTKWVFLSAGERQSKELMAIAAIHARAIGAAIDEIEGTFRDEETKAEYKQLEIRFPNGSRIVGLPANPSTARGHSANILLDEFAFHKDSRAIWAALFPTVTRGYKIRIISTPQGKKNKFYELWTAKTLQLFDGAEHEIRNERGGYSKHRVTIHQAVTMGLELKDEEGKKIEPEDLRLALNDDEAWAQEYEVEFLDETTAWLTYDLIEGVEDQRILAEPSWVTALLIEAAEHYDRNKSLAAPAPFTPKALEGVPFTGPLYLGFDVARHRDLAVAWLDEDVEGIAWTRAVIAMKKAAFGIQENVVFSLLALPTFRRACIDKTGIGEQISERAVNRFGEHKVEPVQFTAQSKEALATTIKKNFEDRKDRIPADQTIRQSLHSVKKIATTTGHFRFDAERTEKIGHADHFWAKALCDQARDTTGPPVIAVSETTDTDYHAERERVTMGRRGDGATGSMLGRMRSLLRSGRG